MQEYYLNSEKKICLMELSEFKELEGAYPHKRNLFRSMNPVQYCKAESYGDCLFGTMKIPRALKGRVTYIVFGFYLRGEELLLIEDGSFLKTCLGRLEKIIPTECSMHQFLVMIFEMLIEDDVIYLQQQEEKLASIEEELLKKIPEHFYEIILQYRKRFSAYHAYYEQLVNLADAMQSDFGQILTDKERSLWQIRVSPHLPAGILLQPQDQSVRTHTLPSHHGKRNHLPICRYNNYPDNCLPRP